MCWRDDVERTRWCIFCGEEYFGDLGHRDCPARTKEIENPLAKEIAAVATRHGWDTETAKKKISRVQEILVLKSPQDAIDFLLSAIPIQEKDIVTELEEDDPPF
jgi:hypothetical protein